MAMRHVAAVAFALGLLAGVAPAELCTKCKARAYTTDVGKCAACGGHTSSGAFKLCSKCSTKLRQCEHCRAKLPSAPKPAPVKPRPAPTTRPATKGPVSGPSGKARANIAPADLEGPFNPANARLLAYTDKWLLWQTHKLIDSTRQYRAQLYVIRFYRQKIGEREAPLALETRDTRVPWKATVLDDGTLVLCFRRRLVWVDNEGKSRSDGMYVKIDKEFADALALYPDGAVFRLWDDPRSYFVPIEGGKLVHDKKVLLNRQKAGGRRRYLRHGDMLAWLAPPKLHLVNLKDGSRKSFVFARKLHSQQNLVAFDGETADAGVAGIDAATGKALGTRKKYRPLLAVRNRVGYYLQERLKDKRKVGHDLMAIDLRAADPKPAVLRAFTKLPPSPAKVICGDGMLLWDGNSWVKVAWLEAPPKTKERTR